MKSVVIIILFVALAYLYVEYNRLLSKYKKLKHQKRADDIVMGSHID